MFSVFFFFAILIVLTWISSNFSISSLNCWHQEWTHLASVPLPDLEVIYPTYSHAIFPCLQSLGRRAGLTAHVRHGVQLFSSPPQFPGRKPCPSPRRMLCTPSPRVSGFELGSIKCMFFNSNQAIRWCRLLCTTALSVPHLPFLLCAHHWQPSGRWQSFKTNFVFFGSKGSYFCPGHKHSLFVQGSFLSQFLFCLAASPLPLNYILSSNGNKHMHRV